MKEEAIKYIEDLREKFERECNGPIDLKRRQELLTNARHATTIYDEDFTKVEMEYAAFATNSSFEFGFYIGARWADGHLKSPWVNTHESLPEAIDLFDTSDLHKKIKWCLCHTKVAYQTYFVGYYAVSIDDEHKVWCNIRGEEVCSPYDVDYYMPLPELPKGGER